MNTRKKEFIRALAEFLTDKQAAKSILLQVESDRPDNDPRPSLAKEWANLRGCTPLHGYPTVEEAEAQLTKFLE